MDSQPTTPRPLARLASAVWNRGVPLSVLRCGLWLLLILQALGAWAPPYVAAAPSDAVVGDGTPESCDGNALEAAISSGGIVTAAARTPSSRIPW